MFMMDMHCLRQAKDPANAIPDIEPIPVLEAGDLASLLEQFEATEHENIFTNNINAASMDAMTEEYSVKWEQAHNEENNQMNNKTSELPPMNKIPKACLKNPTSNTLLDYLPQEVVDRIRVSGKRKPITVIEPLVYFKRTKTTKTDLQEIDKAKNNVTTFTVADMIMLEHNYCSGFTYIFNKKDSGFVSSEEEDRIISGQITLRNIVVKQELQEFGDTLTLDQTKKKKLNLEEYKKRRKCNFKSENTSPSESTCSSPRPSDECNKMLRHQEKLKKMAEEALHATPKDEQNLNIKVEISPDESICNSPLPSDEYEKMLKHQEKLKKMAEEVLHATPKSERKLMNVKLEKISPTESISNSPLPPEDYEKMLRHQEKLKKMAEEVLHATPKCEQKLKNFKIEKISPIANICSSPLPANEHEKIRPQEKLKKITEKTLQYAAPKSEQNSKAKNATLDLVKLPENLERKVIVSFGVNTAWSQDKQFFIDESETVQNSEIEHGENKEVLHLPKDRVRCQTREIATQTDISLINQFRRRRISSSSSSCSTCSEGSVTSRSRLSSESSTTSTSSDSSDSSSSSWQTVATLQSPPQSPKSYSRGSYPASRSSSPSIHRKRSLSPRINSKRLIADREHRNAVEERRIIYVGRIKHSTTKEELQKKFQKFGPITKISLHFREQGENYGFVTFRYKQDAHEAYEQGNNDPAYANFKISFGGRREFCQNPYADLDNMEEDKFHNSQGGGDSFDNLLKEMQEKLKRRK